MTSTVHAWNESAERNAVVSFIDVNLRGVSQVFFQSNPLTGLLILIAIFWGSIDADMVQVGIGGVVGVIVGTSTAMALRVHRDTLRQGMYGFSPVLTGMALTTFLDNSVMLWVYLVIGAAVTAVVTLAVSNLLDTWGVPSSTGPFVLTTWFLLLGAYQVFRLDVGSMGPPALPEAAADTDFVMTFSSLATSMLTGVAQVFLIGSWVSGIIILIAILVSSRWAAGLALAGTIVGTLVAIWFGASATAISEGLWGFSPVLTAIALGCVFLRPSGPVLIYAALGTVFTVFVQAGLTTVLAPLGVPTLTSPYLIAMWLFLLPKPDLAPTPHHKNIENGVLSATKADS
jgi:urea transporter